MHKAGSNLLKRGAEALPLTQKKDPFPPAFKNDEYEVRKTAGTMDPLTPNRVAFPGLAGVARRAFSSVAGFGGPKLTWLRQKVLPLKAQLDLLKFGQAQERGFSLGRYEAVEDVADYMASGVED
ncbi:hypothetical protein ACH5RR_023233 [Cinchona calisaya]|uniref:Uncharacterized protein n=1 Tax=Cinchona calisaya TaxID=153742 RepID=A0ABD2ZA28_9GENT